MPNKKKTIEIKGMPQGEENNINYIFQTASTKLLSEILLQNVDIKYYVRRELANRGVDSSGRWIGFDKAYKHHRIIVFARK